jgi:hypothetical protein
LIALVFFISYVIFQPPSTIICRMVGAKYFLPGITLAWGILLVRLSLSFYLYAFI